MELYVIGGRVEPEEIRAAFRRIHGRDVPRGLSLARVAETMARTNRLRFEFEINRCRGLAFDAEEIQP